MTDQAINYQELAGNLLAQMGTTLKTVPSATPSARYGHGMGGLFSYPGLSRPVFNAMILPRMGLQSILPVKPSRDQSPLYGIFTGVTATSGSNPDGPCDDPKTVGLAKLCMHSFVFGRESLQTKVYEIDRIGLTVNRADFTDLQMLGGPWEGVSNIPSLPGLSSNAALNSEIGKSLFELAVGWAREFAEELYTGNPTNNTANGGRKYFYGMDILINTGYQDAETAQLCPAADSIVKDMGSLEVNTNCQTYVAWITNVYRRLRFIASHAGLEPARWVMVMRWGLFYELTACWPCNYLTYRCSNPDTAGIDPVGSFNTAEAVRMRDEMRGDLQNYTGQYLLIDGERVPVIIDDAITETPLAGSSFSSSIYFVPLSVLGGTPVTFIEHVNYDGPDGALQFANEFAPANSYYTSDGGRFLWHNKPPTNFCVQKVIKAEPRVLLLTPHIAARMTNVKYTPLAHERDWKVDASFYVDGGRSERDYYGPSFHAPTR